ncbi:MAG: CotH kinase family protein [Clostridia bacterium]|nr:CotH kinase family protein [Clostridia bacterium]
MDRSARAFFALFLTLAILFGALAAFFLWRDMRDGSSDCAPLPLTLSENGEILLREGGEAAALSAGAHRITALWKGEGGASLTLFCGDKTAFADLASGVPAEIGLEAGGDLSAVLIPENGTPTAYLASGAHLSSAAAKIGAAFDLICARKLDLGALRLSAPVRMFGDFSFSSLELETDLPGVVVLEPAVPFTAPLTMRAPACDLYLHGVTPAFDPAEAAYWLRVPKLDGKPLFTGTVPVSSEKELARLLDPGTLPRAESGDVVRVTAPISLTADLSFDGFLSFDLASPLTSDGGVLRLSSRESGALSVTVADGVQVSPAVLELELPFVDLTWTGAVPPRRTVMERLSNLRSYNGEKTELGGAGVAVPELILREGSVLEKDAVFSATGNTLVATVPYRVTAGQLSALPYSLSAAGGKAVLESETIAPGAVIRVTDGAGESRRYTLVFQREAKNIPVIYLETDGGAAIESRTKYVSGLFSMDKAQSGYDDVPLTGIRIRGRGNSTWKWDKKPYKIHFDEPVSLFGLPAAEEWALLANYADKSLMRNHLALVMADFLSFDYVPVQVPVDVFLNGEYQGVYSLGEHLEEGPGRVEVIHDSRRNDCGYFLEAGGVVSGVDVRGMNYFHAGLVKFVLIKGPAYNELTAVQFNYIRDYLLKADEAVKTGGNWEDYLDADTLVDWMIMIELTNNTDCAWRRSTYMVKDAGQKVKMGTVWDFDLAFGNFSKDVQDYSTWASTNEDDDYVGTTWSTYLLKDPKFQAAFKARWQSVRDDLLALAKSEIDRSYEEIAPSAEENFIHWQILGRKVAFERKDTTYYTTYRSQIDYLKDFLEDRAAWIDGAVAAWDVK